MCVGIDFCTKKNCLENERCVLYEPKHITPCEVRRGPKKRNKKTDIKVNLCKQNIKFCSNARVCEILGQCMLDHTSVNGNEGFTRELRKAKCIKSILKIFERFIPEKKWKHSKRK